MNTNEGEDGAFFEKHFEENGRCVKCWGATDNTVHAYPKTFLQGLVLFTTSVISWVSFFLSFS